MKLRNKIKRKIVRQFEKEHENCDGEVEIKVGEYWSHISVSLCHFKYTPKAVYNKPIRCTGCNTSIVIPDEIEEKKE